MDANRFDRLTRTFTLTRSLPRRGLLGVAALALPGLAAPVAAGKKGLRKRCSGKNSCKGSLTCGKPTTRHTCSSTVDGVKKWCCVKPGGKCSECDCCGNYYCGGEGACIPNPEG